MKFLVLRRNPVNPALSGSLLGTLDAPTGNAARRAALHRWRIARRKLELVPAP